MLGPVLFTSILSAQSSGPNRAINFSFETAGSSESLASSWIPQGAGYKRALVTSLPWDGSFALELSGTTAGTSGGLQRIILNQTLALPVLITVRVKGAGIQNLSSDKHGAVLYCRVKRTNGFVDYCPTTAKVKNVGTFNWRYVGINTATMIAGKEPIEWIEVVPLLGAVTGTAWFDDVQVKEYSFGSFQGAVSIVADDGFKEHRTFMLPAMASYGYCGSVAIVTEYLSSGDPAYMTLQDLREVRDGCFEVMSHGLNHPDLATLSSVAMEDQFYWSKRFFAENGFSVKSFALPFGGYNALVLGTNREMVYFSSVRKVERGYNPVGSFPDDIKIQAIESGTTHAEVLSWLAEASSRRLWLVIVVHKIRETCHDLYCTTPALFSNMLTAVQASSLTVVTYEEGLVLVKSPR